ncbi:hypothetical protein DPMN_044279 [Dreissena polymorpha]|uniref:Uncharacterized protein n=1 Tax=Dreissena polymorpha TaxID=45954 RepID=A0A9D4D1Z6_DREPO|nr:hypothetical protein DPMN_044279 [Dreissena polymorpha]
MHLLTECHEDWTIYVASRVLTRFYYSLICHKRKNAPLLGGHVIQANVTNKSYDHISSRLEINVASRVLTRKNAPPPGGNVFQPTGIIFINLLTKFHEDWTINVASREKCPAPWQTWFFKQRLPFFNSSEISVGKNILSKFHEERKINVACKSVNKKKCPAPGGHVFQPTGIIFELVQDIIGMNLLTMFDED